MNPIKAFILFAAFWPIFAGTAQNRIGSGKVNELYQASCASCHGKQLEGGSGQSLIDDIWKHGLTDADIAKSIRDGFPELGMAPWKDVFSEDQIRSLVIYIREQNQLADKDALAKRLEPNGGVFKTEKHSFEMQKVVDASLVVAMRLMLSSIRVYAMRTGIRFSELLASLAPRSILRKC